MHDHNSALETMTGWCDSPILPNRVQDVAVSVVGKYRYHMYSPAEHDRSPVIVDIILVGRTKIITLHSGIWLENRTDRKVAFRLHVPITPLVAPGKRADVRQRDSDDIIGPLRPGSGESAAISCRPGPRDVHHTCTANELLILRTKLEL